MLILSLAALCVLNPAPVAVPWRAAAAVGAVLSLAVEIVALVVDVPVGDAYGGPGQQRPVSVRGLYAACRHPGVLAFFPLSLFLWLAWGLPWTCALLFSLLDLGLAVFEDILIFPTVLRGYPEYRKQTPFIWPRPSGLARCLADYRQRMRGK